MKGFFPIRGGDLLFLVAFLLLSALGFFLPWLREATFAGVAAFGWWMAALMVVVPAVALLRVLREPAAGAPAEPGPKPKEDAP